jgi:hypothetical protein
MSGTRIRQKFAKKRSLHRVNEHFSQIFNTIIVPRSNRAKVSSYEFGPIFVFNDKDSSEDKLMTKKAKSM